VDQVPSVAVRVTVSSVHCLPDGMAAMAMPEAVPVREHGSPWFADSRPRLASAGCLDGIGPARSAGFANLLRQHLHHHGRVGTVSRRGFKRTFKN